jgi:ATP-binding cassette, subfamily C, bacterial CydD
MHIASKFFKLLPGIRLYLATAIIIGTISGLLIIVQAYSLSHLINAVFLLSQTLTQVWRLMLLLLAVILLRAIMAWCSMATANRIASLTKISLREKLLLHLFALGPAYTRSERSGELINTIVEGVESLDPYFSQYLPQFFLSLLIPVLLLIAVFQVDIPSAIILLIMAPILPFMLAIAGMMAGAETKRRWQTLSLLNAHFLDVLQGLTTLKLFGCSEQEVEYVRTISERFRQATMGTLRLAFFSSLILEEGAAISTAIIAVEVGLRLLLGQLTFQSALFVLLLVPEFFQPLRLLGTKYHTGRNGVVAMQRISAILDIPVQHPLTPEPPSVLLTPPSPGLNPIHFVDVSYAYDSQRPALQSVSFQISPGQKVALVGPSGAGKSTIAQLLLRFIDADSGAIYIGNTSLVAISPQAWRKQVAWVPQHPYLFNASVAENIHLGCPQATLREIKEAAQSAHAHQFICSLPQGYDTIIGEQGSRLSGGEAQRISLARAFLKNAPLLILDEATSFLDPQYEVQILDALAHLTQGRTVLIIAHRLSTIYDADQIIVVNDGRVVDVGTHHTLLLKSGIYQQLISVYKSVSH